MLNRAIVLENDLVFGSVNANKRHYEAAAEALARADRGWLGRMITRRVPLDRWREALEREQARRQGRRRAGRVASSVWVVARAQRGAGAARALPAPSALRSRLLAAA